MAALNRLDKIQLNGGTNGYAKAIAPKPFLKRMLPPLAGAAPETPKGIFIFDFRFCKTAPPKPPKLKMGYGGYGGYGGSQQGWGLCFWD